jgi:FHS family L-fucose permease-like MFS transporter
MKSKNFYKSTPIFLAFLCMGFGDAVGPFVGLAKDTFELSNFMATLVQFIGFTMFLLLSIPMGIYQDRTSRKHVLRLGLLIALIGLVIPIFKGLDSYALFLLAIMFLGGGAAILQVSGNPIMRDVSAEGKFARNLTLGQFVKAIGSLSGPIIPVIALRWFGADWSLVFPIYSIALLITLVWISFVKVDEKKEKGNKPASFASSFKLLGNNFVLLMVMGIFLYVGAEQCMSSGIPLLLDEKYDIDIQSLGVAGTGLFFLALVIGRFLGAMILNWISARNFLVITVMLSIVGSVTLLLGIKILAIVSIFFIGLGFANIFPLIFSIAVEKMPERTNELSGLMISAIVGGAILPLIMGQLADMGGITVGLLVPLAAVIYIMYLATKIRKT